VDRLQQRPDDRVAAEILRDAERSLLDEAAAGHLHATIALVGAYENLVTPLDDGDARCSALRARVAEVLVRHGDSIVDDDPGAAGKSWALAATLDPIADAVDRLRGALLPPENPEPGEVWRSPIDGSELVFQPPMQFDFGCSSGDSECQEDEIGRWVQAEGFWIDRTEVTNRRYTRCVDAGACLPPVESEHFSDPSRADDPVVGVSWWQAQAYASWAGRRLPSEVEWERAARGVYDAGKFPWGRGRERGLANLEGTTDDDVFEGTAPAGSFPATGLGLHDMAGNVWEWCEDSYHRDLSRGPRDHTAWVTGGWGRVLRGGSWRRTIEVARLSSRDWQRQEYFADDAGFRCVADTTDRVEVRELVSLAQRGYPLPARPGNELVEADLSAADRRYLERTALTWLVLEGRVTEALPRAVALLRRDPRDPVALDLLEQLEREMASTVRRGDVVTVRAALFGYRNAVEGDRRLARRLAAYEERLLDEMRLNVESFVERGDRTLITATVRLASELNPDHPVVVRLRASIEPTAGSARSWPVDGKPMVWIPSGSYRMGASQGDGSAAYDEHPARQVTVDGFWLDQTEVTNDEYRQCVEARVCTPPGRPNAFNDPNLGSYPVLWVDWYQASTYAKWAGKRLPSESEWEWAARAAQPSRYPWGELWEDGVANAMGALGQDRWGGPSPVASFPANAWGLYDMLGNASEWVEDRYHRNYWDAPKDDRPWTQMTGGPAEPRRVLRGGGHHLPPARLRVSYRDDRAPSGFNRATGFRCAAD
jgi:formylglycine-generating enzyme required for sulfatase activity